MAKKNVYKEIKNAQDPVSSGNPPDASQTPPAGVSSVEPPAPEGTGQLPQEKKNPLFQERTSDLDGFLRAKMDPPKKQFAQPEQPEAGGQEEKKEEPAGDQFNKSQAVGKVLFLLFDRPLILGASLISGEDSEKFRIPKEDRDELIDAWTTMAGAYDWKKPPAWIVILILMSIAYGQVYYRAVRINMQKTKEKKEKGPVVTHPAAKAENEPAKQMRIVREEPQKPGAAIQEAIVISETREPDPVFMQEDFEVPALSSEATEQEKRLHQVIRELKKKASEKKVIR